MLYGWGLVGTKGDPLLPVSPKAVDHSGHCCYPAHIRLPTKAAAVKVAADMGVFAVLMEDKSMIAWGSPPFSPSPAVVCPAGLVADCDVTAKGIVFVSNEDGSLYGIGPVMARTSQQGAGTAPILLLHKVDDSTPFVGVAACGLGIVAWNQAGIAFGVGSKLTNGIGTDTADFAPITALPPVKKVNLGSRHAGAVTSDGKLFVWGDGLSGNLGQGNRNSSLTPIEVKFFSEKQLAVVDVGCTRGQPDPKRNGTVAKCATGQEGLRCHAVTANGQLWTCGTSHKGLGGDHLNKTMQPDHDLLNFYCVGSAAADATETTVVPTGAAEDLADASMAAVVARRMGMKDVSLFGKDGCTNYLTDCQIVASTPGHIHSLALAADGRLFAWGCGSDGRTGLRAFMRGPGGAKRTLKCYVSTPSVIEEIENATVTYATVGRYWSLAILQPLSS